KPFLVRFLAGFRHPKAPVLGTEFAGVVEEVGSGVDRFAPGDRVCGYCEGTFGAHAEYVTVPAHRLIAHIPPDRTFGQAAPSLEGSHYAMAFLRLADVQPGDAVFVYGATGAIGSAAVQLAKRMGASVTAVCGTEHLDLVRDLGADRVVDYQREDFSEDDRRYDLVLDAVGKTSIRRCWGLLKPEGVFSASEGWSTIFLSFFGRFSRGRRVVFPFPRSDPEAVRFLIDLIESGGYTPLIDRTVPFEDMVDAYRYVETGQKVGSVVIDVSGADKLA
ncbi:MAG: NAD(P)-dependent alcohol dehydrogenase, partial [Halobacteriales archaeon]|nr:NAD(P)-dependent alcohol dehydrogenase [Halobacteriales archaeon]